MLCATTRLCWSKFSLSIESFHRTRIKSRPEVLCCLVMSSASKEEPQINESSDGFITLQEWQRWGPVSPVPAMVENVIEDLKVLEQKFDEQIHFGGLGGKLQGYLGVLEDKKHRATYQALDSSEKKFQFYSARQIACRLLGSRGYLCQKCWLAMEDCMCSKIQPCTLWHGMRFWLYMHPKDFLRQNNTGKLLWQVFGVQNATLCLYGIPEDEEIMWNAFKLSGKSKVWCLYPNENQGVKSVQSAFDDGSANNIQDKSTMTEDKIMHFVLIDGTWNNSAAMFRRLKEQTKSVWGEEDLPCISLAAGASAMHKLRPQPSWDRTCTAAAAIGLLSELQVLPAFSACKLDEQAESLEDAVVALLEALTTRRKRMGRSIKRTVRGTASLF